MQISHPSPHRCRSGAVAGRPSARGIIDAPRQRRRPRPQPSPPMPRRAKPAKVEVTRDDARGHREDRAVRRHRAGAHDLDVEGRAALHASVPTARLQDSSHAISARRSRQADRPQGHGPLQGVGGREERRVDTRLVLDGENVEQGMTREVSHENPRSQRSDRGQPDRRQRRSGERTDDDTMKFTTTFPFMVGHQTMPAGSYTVTPLEGRPLADGDQQRSYRGAAADRAGPSEAPAASGRGDLRQAGRHLRAAGDLGRIDGHRRRNDRVTCRRTRTTTHKAR